jgi:hypothetical protein
MSARALQSLAERGVPYLLAVLAMLVGIIWQDITSRLDKQDAKYDAFLSSLHDLQVDEAFQRAQIGEHERRLDKLEMREPISDRLGFSSIGVEP